MMDRRTFLGSLALLAVPFAAEAQPGKNTPHVGILSPPEPLTALDVFQRGLRDLGYTEGDGVRIQYRSSGGHDDHFPAMAAELVALKVDVILAITPPAIRAAQGATATIPIVMVLSGDPVRSGLVQSLARPGGNTTGPATLTADLAAKRLEVFKEAVPNLREVVFLANPTYPGIREAMTQTESAGRTLGVRVRSSEVRAPIDIDTAFAAMLRARPGGLLIMPDPVTSAQMTRIVEFATKHRLPAMDGRKQFPERGGLVAYGIDYAEHVRASIRYADRILKGAKPADLPVEQPTKFELVINLKTAKALGLTIPQSLLLRADQVIQ
jgi:putative tryptophan/tyrosine transport system substrate-binding protein